jgi:hypothetical protein
VPEPLPTIAGALAKAHAAYRSAPVAERIQLRLRSPGDRDRSSSIVMMVNAGGPEHAGTLRLELGRLLVTARADELLAFNAQDPTTYFRAPLPSGLSLDSIKVHLPRVPLPQLAWALDAQAPDPAHAAPLAGEIVWEAEPAAGSATEAIYTGASQAGGVQLVFDPQSWRLVRFSLPVAPAAGSTLEASVTAIEPLPSSEWLVPTQGREPVASLAALRPKPSDILPGARLPTLGLITAELESVSLSDEMRRSDVPIERPTFAALILYRPLGDSVHADAAAGVRAAAGAADLLAERSPELHKRPRLHTFIVPSLELGSVSRERLQEVNQQWEQPGREAPPRFFSPHGSAVIDRLAPRVSVALVVIDADQHVLGIVPLDGRSNEEGAIASEIVAQVTEAMKPLPGEDVPPR